MLKAVMKRLIVLVAGFGFLASGFSGAVNAAMIGTESAVAQEQRVEYINDIQGWMARDQVAQQLVEFGVEPANAAQRVAAMTTEELRILHNRIEDMPAGASAIGVIGVVFLVLLILELVGVTNIFNSI